MGEMQKASSSMQLDSILEELGNFGRYQMLHYSLIVIPIILSAFFTTSYVFTGAKPSYRCEIPGCDANGVNSEFEPSWLSNAIPLKHNDIYDECKRFADKNMTVIDGDSVCPSSLFNSTETVTCENWIYNNTNSIVSEFNLACQEWKHTLLGTVNNIGQFVCLPLTGLASDKFGRKTVLIGGIVLSGIVGILKSFSWNYWSFVFFEFLDPMLGSGVYSAGFILSVELVGPKYRVLGSTFVGCAYAIGEMLLGIIAWNFPYWRVFLRIGYIPALLIISYCWIIPESVRWLLSKGKSRAAGNVLVKAATVNGVILSPKTLENLYTSVEQDQAKNPNQDCEGLTSQNKSSPLILALKSRIILVRLVCCSMWWMTCTFVYYGLSLNSVSIAGNMYLNFILVSMIEIPGYIAYYFVVDSLGRRLSLCLSFLGSGIACFAFPYIPTDIAWLTLAVYLFGKFSITVAFTVLYVYTTELYPTPLRHSLLGTCSMFGRLGSIVAPQTPLLGVYMKSLPLLLFGGTSLISGLMVLAFPETNKMKLPDTIEEAENISKLKINRS